MPAGGSITSITVATSKERKLFSLMEFSGLNIWNYELNDSEISTFQNCNNFSIAGNLLSWKDSVNTFVPTGSTIETVEKESICDSNKPEIMIIPEEISYDMMNKLCSSFGATIHPIEV